MSEDFVEKHFGYLWNNPNNRWVLVGKDNQFSIFESTTHDYLIIEDDDLDKEVIERMIAEGCEQFATRKEFKAKHPLPSESSE
jgi:hypothetical protein